MAPARTRVDATLHPSRLILVAGLPLALAAGVLLFIGLTSRDRARRVTRAAEAEHRRLEAALQQARRMEALGRLAGGVAHDFNNLLTVIMSSTHLLATSGTRDRAGIIEAIEDAAQRGARLTRELLVFGRGDPASGGPLDLAVTVTSLRGLLTRLVPRMIAFEIVAPSSPVMITGTAVQVEQIVVNLVMNAVAAMPDGGTIAVAVAVAGEHAVLTVRDTGHGISPSSSTGSSSRSSRPRAPARAPGSGSPRSTATSSGWTARSRSSRPRAAGRRSPPGSRSSTPARLAT